MRRREFIAGLGSVAAGTPAAWAQQPAMPVVGFIDMRPAPEDYQAFLQGLSEAGFVDHRNVVVERREAADPSQISTLSVDLVHTKLTVICGPVPAIRAALAVSTTIPMVFIGSTDPVQAGLVASFNHPGGNITGVRLSAGELPAKQLELAHELMPNATRFGLLINPKFTNTAPDTAVALSAAKSLGIEVIVERVTEEAELERAFTNFSSEAIQVLLLNGNLFFGSHRDRLAALALELQVPMVATSRVYATAGAVMGYGASTPDVIRQAGIYVGRILKGEKPADLPVLQPTRFDLVINLKTAKVLNIAISPNLLARADEVIE
jgi:putative tryptophan/tyrosine transport system substrate-binding protein